MRNSGVSAVGILFTVVLITIVTIALMKAVGVNNSGTGDVEVNTEEPIERAKVVECIMRLQSVAREIKMYQVEGNQLPAYLEDVTEDSFCPVSGEDYEYDSETGEVWCAEHS
jgi:hypothetical protein